MNLTAPSIDSMTLNVVEEIHVRASLEVTFAALPRPSASVAQL